MPAKLCQAATTEQVIQEKTDRHSPLNTKVLDDARRWLLSLCIKLIMHFTDFIRTTHRWTGWVGGCRKLIHVRSLALALPETGVILSSNRVGQKGLKTSVKHVAMGIASQIDFY